MFRDRLRNEPVLWSEYEALKLQFVERYADNKPAHSAKKGLFILSSLVEAGC